MAGGFFPHLFGEFAFTREIVTALILFVVGGVLISYDLPFRKNDTFPFSAVIAGFLLGVSLLLLKYGYAEIDFINGLIWSRLGMVAAGITLLLVPVYRREILVHHELAKMKSKQNLKTLALFVVNKSCAGFASFLIIYATKTGSVSFVQALNGIQYVFLLFLAVPMSVRFPHIFGEHLGFWDWAQKVLALSLIAAGFWLASFGGVSLF